LAPGFVQQVQVKDDNCVGRGEAWRSKGCKACPNGRTEPEETRLTVDVIAGMRNGEPIAFEGVADEQVGMQAGDLIFVLTEQKHEYFTRDGDNLYLTVSIPLVDALVGFKHTITHLDGIRKVEAVITDITECDEVRRISGEGMPRRSGTGRGDLFLTFEVDFPTKLNEEQKAGIEKLLRGDFYGQ
jgi:DnaJ-class molecular chaperone